MTPPPLGARVAERCGNPIPLAPALMDDASFPPPATAAATGLLAAAAPPLNPPPPQPPPISEKCFNGSRTNACLCQAGGPLSAATPFVNPCGCGCREDGVSEDVRILLPETLEMQALPSSE